MEEEALVKEEELVKEKLVKEIDRSNGIYHNPNGHINYVKDREEGNSILAIIRHILSMEAAIGVSTKVAIGVSTNTKYAALAKFISLLYGKYVYESAYESADVDESGYLDVETFIGNIFAGSSNTQKLSDLRAFLSHLLNDKTKYLNGDTDERDKSILDALTILISMLRYIDSGLAESLQTSFGSDASDTLWRDIYYSIPREIFYEDKEKLVKQKVVCTFDNAIVTNTRLDTSGNITLTKTIKKPPIHRKTLPDGKLPPQVICELLNSCKDFVQNHFLHILYGIIRSKELITREDIMPYKILLYNYFMYNRLICSNFQPFSPYAGETAILGHRVSRSAERQHAGDSKKCVCCDASYNESGSLHNIRLDNTKIKRCVINICPMGDKFRLTITNADASVADASVADASVADASDVDDMVITPMNCILDVDTSMDQRRKLDHFLKIVEYILANDLDA